MRLAHDYLQLRKSFPHMREGQAFPVTMAELANVLYCTQRNVKLILSKMIDLGWICFVSGRGRGHTSELTFLLQIQQLLLQEAQQLVKSGELEAAFYFIKENSEGSFVKEQFLEWLGNYFGYQVERQENQVRETLKLPIYRPIITLDPAETYFAFDSHMVKQIFSTLVEYDVESGQAVGGIAHHWKANEQATEWIFYLRKGVYFHHGRELVADDVQYSLTRLGSASCTQNWLVRNIESITVVSKHILKIHLQNPNHLFLRYLSFPPASIVPRDIYEKRQDSDQISPIGSGPFRVVKRTPGSCVLEAFEQHFQGRPLIDRVEILIVPEMNDEFRFEPRANLLLVDTGEAKLASVTDWKEEGELTGTNVMTVNLKKKGILHDWRVRTALCRLINRARMIGDLGAPRLFPSASFMWSDQPDAVDHEWNVDEAVELLSKSAYNGEPISLYTFPRHAPDAYWLKSEYEKYGIRLDVNIVSWSGILERENMEKADLILFEAVLSEGIIRMIEYYQSANSALRSHLDDRLCQFVDEKISELLAEPDVQGRERILREIEHKLKAETAIVFLAYKNVSTISHPALHGIKVNPRGWVDFKNVWFEHDRLIGGE